MDEVSVTIASWSDREDLVVELETSAGDFGLVSLDPSTGLAIVEIYPRTQGGEWRFDLASLRIALEVAHRSALENAPITEPVKAYDVALTGRHRSG